MSSVAYSPALAHPNADLNGSHGKILDLQVLRGVSILLVFLQHFSLPATLLGKAPQKISAPFYLGVEIFFIISGFVITKSLKKDDFHAARFFVRRLFRLMPAMIVCLILAGLLNGLPYPTYTTDWPNFFRQARSILLGYFILSHGPVSYFAGAMWSLSVEDQFYAGIALLCLVLGWVFRRKPRAIEVCVGLVAAAVYISVMFLRLKTLFGWQINFQVPWLVRHLFEYRFDFLAMGILLAMVDQSVKKWVQATFRHSGPFISAFLLLLPLVLVAICEDPMRTPDPILRGLGYPVSGLAFAALVLLAANDLCFPSSRGPIYRFMVYLGDRSYSLYLFHFSLFIVGWTLTNKFLPWAFHGPITYGIVQIVIDCAIILPVVHLVYAFIELPGIEVGKRVVKAMRKRDNSAKVPCRQSAKLHAFPPTAVGLTQCDQPIGSERA